MRTNHDKGYTGDARSGCGVYVLIILTIILLSCL